MWSFKSEGLYLHTTKSKEVLLLDNIPVKKIDVNNNQFENGF